MVERGSSPTNRGQLASTKHTEARDHLRPPRGAILRFHGAILRFHGAILRFHGAILQFQNLEIFHWLWIETEVGHLRVPIALELAPAKATTKCEV